MKFTIRSKVHGVFTVQVDPQDAHFLRNWVWNIHLAEGQFYLRRAVKPAVTTALHREIMSATKDEIVRFRNGDQHDMRRANLIKEPIAVAKKAIVANMLVFGALYRVAHVQPRHA